MSSGSTPPWTSIRSSPARAGAGDGIVPLASAHLEGAASELLVRAGHVCLEEREVIRETARILAEHVRHVGRRNVGPGGDAMNANGSIES